ncbi:MAG: hypothetical protein KatS3mg132_812 [Limisphaera sp.]|nr:MAG: hypothetical protein KatS3mg132_812 [Limisphaera sp.]
MESKNRPAIEELLQVMARLRSPGGCPWDRKQTHQTLRMYAVEEVYELLDAIEAGDDEALLEELGDVLLQVVFHAQLARERGAFDFDAVARRITDKLIHRHPHVFGKAAVKDAGEVLVRWDELKRQEKQQRGRPQGSVFDGIPRHLPALMRATELIKKAKKAGLVSETATAGEAAPGPGRPARWTPRRLASQLWALVELAQAHGWSAETLLREESQRRERQWRQWERRRLPTQTTRAKAPEPTVAKTRSRRSRAGAARPGGRAPAGGGTPDS